MEELNITSDDLVLEHPEIGGATSFLVIRNPEKPGIFLLQRDQKPVEYTDLTRLENDLARLGLCRVCPLLLTRVSEV